MDHRAAQAPSKVILALGLAILATLPGGQGRSGAAEAPAASMYASHARGSGLFAFSAARRAFAAASCSGIQAPTERVILRRDLPYAVLSGRTLHLDLARPASARHAPVVLLVHGGGFRGGDKRDLERLLLGLAGGGYATASVEYRLVGRGEAEFPAGVADVRCAARFLKRRAGALGVDAGRMAAIGFSAGGHLAASLALQNEVGALDGDCVSREALALDGVIAFYPPLDFRPAVPWGPHIRSALRRVFSRGRRRLSELERLASPIAYADAKDAPLLLIHGTEDRIVPVARSRDALRAALHAGAPVGLLEVEAMAHGFGMSRPDAPRSSTCAALAFLHATLDSES